MNWGKSIVLAFVLFVLFIGTLVVVCLRQDIPLVSTNYYEEELRYQMEIDRMNNANSLKEKPNVSVVGNGVEVRYSRLSEIAVGELILFRPSDARFDRKFVLNGNGPIQRFKTQGLPGGMYKAKLRWTLNGIEYSMESTIHL